MAVRHDMNARILLQEEVGPDTFLMRFEATVISEYARPGQFIMIRLCGYEGHDPLLRRPFSIHAADPDKGTVDILYRVVGRGTRQMSGLAPGMALKVLGPLGRGFSLHEERTPVLVGGGLGVAPLLFLARHLKGQGGSVILGAVTSRQLLRLDAFENTGLDLLVATEDGSAGVRGLVTGVLDNLLKDIGSHHARPAAVYSCGPMPMLKAVAGVCMEYAIECQVSIEAVMACGLGLCLGCAVKARHDGYVHVCREGPVFYSDQIDWEQL